MTTNGYVTVDDAATLRSLIGDPLPRVATKARGSLDDIHCAWLAHAPFCLVATSGAAGSCDVSPKGDPPGFTLVLDRSTIALPERPGNKRADSFHNILANPHVGLLYVIPGRTDTLRINGPATIVSDAPFFDAMIEQGHRPTLALVVHVEQVFFHCAKAFLRSDLWQPESWSPDAVPSRAQIAQLLERPEESLAALETYYGEQYRAGLYRG